MQRADLTRLLRSPQSSPMIGVSPRPARARKPGVIGCEVLAQWRDSSGTELVRVTTERPDGIESTEGLSEFIVSSGQVAAT